MALGDMFLKIDGQRQGPIRGESEDPGHLGEIDVLAWSWGMECLGEWYQDKHTKQGGRTSIQELVVSKRVDSATTALMSALRNNEAIKSAVLSVRKAGGTDPVDYLKITIERARISAHRVNGGGAGGEVDQFEEVRFAFQKVRVEYRSQSKTGGGKGTSTFETEIDPA